MKKFKILFEAVAEIESENDYTAMEKFKNSENFPYYSATVLRVIPIIEEKIIDEKFDDFYDKGEALRH